MKVKAKINFAGKVSMYTGEVREVSDETAKPLIDCGYVEALTDKTPEKVKTTETKKEDKKGEGKRVKR